VRLYETKARCTPSGNSIRGQSSDSPRRAISRWSLDSGRSHCAQASYLHPWWFRFVVFQSRFSDVLKPSRSCSLNALSSKRSSSAKCTHLNANTLRNMRQFSRRLVKPTKPLHLSPTPLSQTDTEACNHVAYLANLSQTWSESPCHGSMHCDHCWLSTSPQILHLNHSIEMVAFVLVEFPVLIKQLAAASRQCIYPIKHTLEAFSVPVR